MYTFVRTYSQVDRAEVLVNHPGEKLQIRSHTSVAVTEGVLRYGTADAVLTLPRPVQTTPAAGRLKFFVGEVTGILFIALSTLFIFVVPTSLAGQLTSLVQIDLKTKDGGFLRVYPILPYDKTAFRSHLREKYQQAALNGDEVAGRYHYTLEVLQQQFGSRQKQV